MKKQTILIVDDDIEIVKVLGKLLETEEYLVEKSYNGLEALEVIQRQEIDLILLDIMMPKLNGLAALMKLRADYNIPVILLSAKTEDSDKVLGLSMGADDYMEKPFNTAELIARVKSQLRRYLMLGSKEQKNQKNRIRVGDLELNIINKELLVCGELKKLTATEYKIIELLMSNPGRVFSAEDIYCSVWKEDGYCVENTVMVHIRHIREKIEIEPKNPKYVKVVWGIGYKMEKI